MTDDEKRKHEERIEPELRELRDRVLHVYTLLDTSVGWLLWKWITEVGKDFVPKGVSVQMGSRFDLVIGEMDFGLKVTLVQKLKLLPDTLGRLLLEVNALQLVFSQPKSHETQVKALSDRKEQRKAQKTLQEAYDGVKKTLQAAYSGMEEVLQVSL